MRQGLEARPGRFAVVALHASSAVAAAGAGCTILSVVRVSQAELACLPDTGLLLLPECFVCLLVLHSGHPPLFPNFCDSRCCLALLSRPLPAFSPAHQLLQGFSGAWTFKPAELSNEYFKILLGLEWQKVPGFSQEEWRVSAEEVALFLNRVITWEEEGQYV